MEAPLKFMSPLFGHCLNMIWPPALKRALWGTLFLSKIRKIRVSWVGQSTRVSAALCKFDSTDCMYFYLYSHPNSLALVEFKLCVTFAARAETRKWWRTFYLPSTALPTGFFLDVCGSQNILNFITAGGTHCSTSTSSRRWRGSGTTKRVPLLSSPLTHHFLLLCIWKDTRKPLFQEPQSSFSI